MTALSPKVRVKILNASGMDIPPRSVVVAIGVVTTSETASADAESYTLVHQYGCGRPGNVMVTGPETIRAGNYGSAYFDQFLYVSIDDSISDPAPGEEWGPSDGSWVLTRTNDTKGFFPQGHSSNGGTPKRSMFLRTFVREPASECSSLSSSSSTSSGSGSGSASGSGSSSGSCGCTQVLADVTCSGGSLTRTYVNVRGCC